MMSKQLTYLILPLLLLPVIAGANSATMGEQSAQVVLPYHYENYDSQIQHLYQTVPGSHAMTISARLAADSSYFLGRPYLLFPTGEGPLGEYDQNPLYRTDAFDCLAYVNTAIALAESRNVQQFQQNYMQLNYHDGKPNFITRNHFTETDWNTYNAAKGYIRDITNEIKDPEGKPIAALRQTIIDKPSWLRAMSASHLKFLLPLSPAETQQRLTALRNESSHFSPQKSHLPYLPMTRLFNGQMQPIAFIFEQIPSGSIIEIINPRPFTAEIGTPIDISHIGFAIRTQQGLMFREASSVFHQVVDIPLAQYLRRNLPMAASCGINIQQVLNSPTPY